MNWAVLKPKARASGPIIAKLATIDLEKELIKCQTLSCNFEARFGLGVDG